MKTIIIKLEQSNTFQPSFEGCKIHKIVSSISPRSFIQLLSAADSKVNPRTAKVNRITKDIQETLRTSPELFWFKTKGILICTESCESLERNRIRISLSSTEYEGVMDGGHNMLAIASYLVEELFDGQKLKTWDDCKSFWDENYDEILKRFDDRKNEFLFSIPIEIIAPTDEQGALDDFYDSIAEICAARNNNVQLSETSRGNQEGYYEPLKEILGERYDVVWKSGDAGKIKADDVIAMATLGLIFLSEKKLLPDNFQKSLNRSSLYSQKSKCVEFYNWLMKGLNNKEKGKSMLNDDLVRSALRLTDDTLQYFDRLYFNFRDLYNVVSPGFGRIGVVKNIPSKVPFGTIDQKLNYQYPYGFFYPLLYGLIKLMRFDENTNTISWIINPATLELTELDLRQYVDLIRMVNYDPQKIGKTNVFYNEAENIYERYLKSKGIVLS